MAKQKFVSLAELKKSMGGSNGVESTSAPGAVYSTELGKTCPVCGKAISECSCSSGDEILGDGKVRISRETKGRKGKGVTLIKGLPLTGKQLNDLCKKLKQRCGVGGVVKDAVIEIQGDQRDTVLAILLEQGFDAKKSGG